MKCRHCSAPLSLQFVDLGSAPPSNAYLTKDKLSEPEVHFPLRVLTCTRCWLVQTEDYAGADEIFTDEYAYFSSFSKTWMDHSERYVASMVERFALGQSSHVIEIAANDGYLLQFVAGRGIPCLGIEPTLSTANAARQKGIRILQKFFGRSVAQELSEKGQKASLIIANNVLAHVPDINDFLSGVSLLLRQDGVATFEFPHLLNLVVNNQFDTIYHEHYSYLSLSALVNILSVNGLTAFDVDEIPTHGGSLRVYARRREDNPNISDAVEKLLRKERVAGLNTEGYYAGFQFRVERAKNAFVNFLLDAQESGKQVAGYGAAAKGNTLINYAGIRSDLVPYVVDKSPSKQGKYLPGSRIPIVSEQRIRYERPEYVLILPWNIAAEVTEDLSYIREWGGQFVTAIPEMRLL